MRNTSIMTFVFACLYMQSASANGTDSFLTGFFNGMAQKQEQVNAQKAADQTTQNINNALTSQYQQCLGASQEVTDYQSFKDIGSQVSQCISALEADYLSNSDPSPAEWFFHATSGGEDETHKTTKLEAEHLAMLIKKRKECVRPFFNYSGVKNDIVKKDMKYTKQREEALYALVAKYIAGDINRGAFLEKETSIANAYIDNMGRINADIDNIMNAHRAQRAETCNMEVNSTRQAIQQQQLTESIAQQQVQIRQQQQQIQRQQQEIDNANMAAAVAESEAQDARQQSNR